MPSAIETTQADSRNPPAHDVAVILIGVNARNFVQGCLESLEAAAWEGLSRETIYVDNGSTDGTVGMVREHFPDVRVIANKSNLGFCVAANMGCRSASARYYMVINDDVVIVRDAVSLLVRYMDENPDVATAGARLVFPDGREQWSGRRFPNMMSSFLGRRGTLTRVFPGLQTVRAYLCKDELARGEPFDCDWVSAAGQIIRPEPFWAVGGFAEEYYYWHEMALCLRLKRAGHRVALHPQARIIHYEGQGSGPRPFARQRFHIIDFHRGALRAYCEQHNLRRLSPRRWFVAAALASRALALLTLVRARTLFPARTRPAPTPQELIARHSTAGGADRAAAQPAGAL